MMFRGKRILIVGAHPDDIEFGMGATLNQIKKEEIKIVVFCDTVERNDKVILNELDNSMNIYNLPYVLLRDIENMNFINRGREIKQKLFDIKIDFKPDIIFSTSPKSYNPDHRILGESCLSVFLEQTILFYEVGRGDFKHEADMYNKITEEDANIKQYAIKQYVSQMGKTYSNSNTIQARLIITGSQCSANLAESFEVGRIVL